MTRGSAGTRTKSWLLAGFLIVGLLGIALRFIGFSTRLFWTDEGITAMRVAGHTGAQLTATMLDGRAHPVSELLRFAGRGSQGSLRDVVRSLAVEDAQHPPLYYVLSAQWTRLFGASISSLRMISVLFGCIVPLAVGWLCFELYRSRTAAALGFAFAAVSPVLVIYSQQAREYALWAAFIALSSAILLRAVRLHDVRWWVAYVVCAIAGLYTDPLFTVTLVSHAVYAAFYLRKKDLAAFTAAVVISFAAFAPWIGEILNHLRTIRATNGWTAGPWPVRMLVEKWIFNAGTSFFDLEYERGTLAIVLFVFLALAVWAVYWNVIRTRPMQRIMTAALLIAPVVIVFLPDLVLHQHRSSVTRYGMPLYIALIVCVAGFLAMRIRTSNVGWVATAYALLIAGLISSAVDVSSKVWWDNRGDAQNLPISRILNSGQSSLVVIPENNWARALALAYYLRPGISVQMPPSQAAARLIPGFKRGFLLASPKDAATFARLDGPLQLQYAAREENVQVRAFRGTAGGREFLSLWRFENYTGTPP